MSRKRYISTEISNDEKVADLADCSLLATLLYTWAIPHMDDWGRITGNIREFKLLVCPGLDISNRDVEESINHIVNVKLWVKYEVDGKKCISVLNQENWFKHQSYIGKDKRSDDSKSSFPTPQNTEEHRETPKNAEEERKTPENPSSFSFSSSLSFSSSKDSSSGYGNSRQNVFGVYEREIGELGEIVREKLIDLELTYSEEWVKQAIKAAVFADVKKMVYIEGTLRKWKATGHPEPWTLEKEQPQQNKGNVRQFNKAGNSGKPHLPIVTDGPKSAPLSDDKKAELLRMAELLDGDSRASPD